jgi:hypothetical protein
MATLKNTNINDTGFLRLPVGTTAQRPSSPTVGMMRYNTTISNVEYRSDVATWEVIQPLPFLTRQIITTAYTLGGYANAVTWNNVNRTVTATDTTTNLGDNSIDRSFNYKSGACSLNIAFSWGTTNAHNASSNYTTAYNMRTETSFTNQARFNLRTSRGHTGTLFQEQSKCWIAGGGSASVEEFDLITETNLLQFNGTTVGDAGATAGGPWGISHENFGVWYTGGEHFSFHYATKTVTGRAGTIPGNNTQQKSIQSKLINAFAGNEGTYNGGFNLRRTNMITNTTSGTVAKPVGNSGEENLTMGQDHQYMIGMFSTAQNNVAWRWNYATESGFQGSSTMEPKGKTGCSSGTCAWRD